MPNRNLVVIGASAGGIEALQQICRNLPRDLKAAVLVVVHTSPHAGYMLAPILSRVGPIPAVYPEDRERIESGKIYVAPPDCHLLVEDGRLRRVKGPRENRHRPAIDPTFRSAANSYGRRTIGVILTGLLDDGTSGLMVICARGGEAIVQDPSTAMFPSMPKNALRRVPDANVASLEDIPQLIAKLVSEPLPALPNETLPDPNYSSQTEEANYHMPESEGDINTGKPSQFGCPECGGVLWEIDQEGFLRFRRRVGHAYTASVLHSEQRQEVEAALWSALRALEETASLYRRMAERAHSSNHNVVQRKFDEDAANAEANAKTLREFLVHFPVPGAESESPSEAA